jgi:hypothetical protein
MRMDYLSKLCPTYEHESGDLVWKFQHDEVVWDDMNEFWVSANEPDKRVTQAGKRPAQWWAVGVYTRGSAYGGPEEGGWWFDCGELVEHHMIKFFDDYHDAVEYRNKLWDWCTKENINSGDTRVVARGFTEQMPEAFYPKKRPHYC